jgi:hypothetical protein
MTNSIYSTQYFSLCLLILGISGTFALILSTGLVFRRYGTSSTQNFNSLLRNWRLKQLSAIACLFFLAMAASYWVLQDAWGWIYLLFAFKTGQWWFSHVIKRA